MKGLQKDGTDMSVARKIVFVIALMVFLGAGGVIAHHYISGWMTSKALSDLDKTKAGKDDLVTDKGIVSAEYAGLYKKNPDVIGWIKIEGTRIDYPVMQTPDDPEFYLRRNFNKEHSVAGVPFLDADSDIFAPTANWLIYGHHMKDGTMFHDLLKYAEEDFYKEHPLIQFDTIYKGGKGQYKVVAAFYSQIYPEDEDVFKYYTYAGMTGGRMLDAYVAGVRSLSQYNTGVNVAEGEQLITLSTCSYHVPGKVGRFAVVAKKVK